MENLSREQQDRIKKSSRLQQNLCRDGVTICEAVALFDNQPVRSQHAVEVSFTFSLVCFGIKR